MGIPEEDFGGVGGELEEAAGVGEGGGRGEGTDGGDLGEGKGGDWSGGFDEEGVELLEVGEGGEGEKI